MPGTRCLAAGEGIEVGLFRVQPQIEVLGAYEERENLDGDIYGEVAASVEVENTDARYDIAGFGQIGYREYDKFSDASDDFYGLGGRVDSRESPLKIGLRAYQKKTIDYDTRVQDGGVAGLGAYLTSEASTRTLAEIDAGYELPLVGRSAVMPGYEGRYYSQDFESSPEVEWTEHVAKLKYGYGLTDRTLLTLLGSYSAQFSDEEDGTVASALLGAESRLSDKVRWEALAGFAAADYDDSGKDEGPVGKLRVRWQATDKVYAYIFGESRYQPGRITSGAQHLYRVGYGGEWTIIDRLRLSAQVLHDRQDIIQSGDEETSHFLTSRMEYDVLRRITLALEGRYINEDRGDDRVVASLSAVLKY